MTTITINMANSPNPVPSRAPPPYSEYPRDIELTDLESSPSMSETFPFTEAGPSTSSAAPFYPSCQLQIQTAGKALHCLPTPTAPTPIPVFSLTPEGHLHRPLYLSLRPKRTSGSSFLVHGDDEAEVPLSTTTYRFGPGKPPVVRLCNPMDTEAVGEEFAINSLGIFTRSQSMKTSLGTFEWRYAGSLERGVQGADSLLVLERVVITGCGEERRRVAQLVRNERYRTPGTSRSDAGNGGRLMIDFNLFDEKERERAQVVIVTSAIIMLKKEIDRRRRDGPYSLLVDLTF